MKKLFTLLLAVAVSIGTMFAEPVQIGDLYYNLDATNQTAEVASNSSASGEIIIPSSVTYNEITYSVTSIGSSAFYRCTSLTSVTIPNSVTSIGDYTFNYCTSLTSVSLPNSIISIGKEAFRYTNISTIDIPNSVIDIDTMAFQECFNLVSITMSNSVQRIAFGTFYGCNNLTEFVIPANVTKIEDVAFSDCSILSSVSIPNSVTSIGEWAFSYCPNLNTVTNHATTPQVINSNVFGRGVNQTTCTLYVPEESVALYNDADVWKEFTNILPISCALDVGDNVDSSMQFNSPMKSIHNGQIFILRGDKTFTLQGQEVK